MPPATIFWRKARRFLVNTAIAIPGVILSTSNEPAGGIMSSFSAVAVKQISEKLHWAARCLARMEVKDVGFYDVQDNFWGFLTALQQSWNYFYRLVAESNPELSKRQTKEKAKLLIERFKQDELDQNEKKAWNIIQAMRNHDTHSEPVMPEIKEKKVFLTRNSKLLTMDGKLLYKKKTSYVVVFENQDIDVLDISSGGINAIKKLRDFVIKTDFT